MSAQFPQTVTRSHRDLLSISDLQPEEIAAIFDLTAELKQQPEKFRTALAGCHVAMFFEKPSLRTRLSFEAGIAGLGGSTSFVDQRGSRIDERESLADVAHNTERWVQAIVLRTFDHATVTGIAEFARVPVINALTDLEHPCQALADYFTLREHFGDARNVHLAYVGDGNNVAHSLLLTAAALGSKISIATPAGYEPDKAVVAAAQQMAGRTGAVLQFVHDPQEAVHQADAVYTDVWASMGQESQSAQREKIFAPYQVNEKLFACAAPNAIFMHCLPAHRGLEVTDAVIDSPASAVFDEAENRMHVQKAILLFLLGDGQSRIASRSAHV